MAVVSLWRVGGRLRGQMWQAWGVKQVAWGRGAEHGTGEGARQAELARALMVRGGGQRGGATLAVFWHEVGAA